MSEVCNRRVLHKINPLEGMEEIQSRDSGMTNLQEESLGLKVNQTLFISALWLRPRLRDYLRKTMRLIFL